MDLRTSVSRLYTCSGVKWDWVYRRDGQEGTLGGTIGRP